MAEALKQLHLRDWVHGDLHYGNIVVDSLDRARIIDFGLSYNINRINDSDVNLDFLPEFNNYAPELDYVAGISSDLLPNSVINLLYAKKKQIKLINYNPDNPFIFSGKGSGNSNISKSIGFYDFHFTYSEDIKNQIDFQFNTQSAILPFGFDIDESVFNLAKNKEEKNQTIEIKEPFLF